MSLYHETAEVLSATDGNLKARIFGNKDLKSPPQQLYALALETCKWSALLKEIIESSDLLKHERKLTPTLALLLVHDFLLSKRGIALPASHGLRTSIERHKARLSSELTRARLRRKAGSIEALRQQINLEFLGEAAVYPRWVRINALKTTLQEQLEGAFKDFTRVFTVKEVTGVPAKLYYIDEHIPNLLAISPSFEVSKTEAYTSGAIILQDKASCFPAYLLNPKVEDGDVIDTCSAPGNKTTHLAALVKTHSAEGDVCRQTVYAFEKDKRRSKTLEKMVIVAGATDIVRMSFAQDFLKISPAAETFRNVGALLLDPSCSGSGIVGRDSMPMVHLPDIPGTFKKPLLDNNRKRKREDDPTLQTRQQVLVDDDGQEVLLSSEKELKTRLESLSSFQLILLLHAFKFPAARKVTYSTCSIHAEENEQVVLKALESDVAKTRGWRVMKRDEQVRGLRSWPVRGSVEASGGDEEIADACIRSYKDDGRGVMGFFVAGFVRDAAKDNGDDDSDGPYVRDEEGRIVRDIQGMPTLKQGRNHGQLDRTAQHQVPVLDGEEEEDSDSSDDSETDSESDKSDAEDAEDDEWGGFDD
ncbi:S-adenosyl-L-methionine-dependent methyltransferase [Xylariaceae sp. FL0016]|nr:S-adenosyl-L-methionine-dependent methyltransferase [Xylariaceae sp. FL0016]